MRKIATVKNGHPEIRRVILHQSDEGVLLFPCSSLEDGSAIGDEWYKTLDEADNVCVQRYGIGADDWEYIDEPLDGCLQDWIAPVRVKGRNTGKPQWGTFERLEEDGAWHELSSREPGAKHTSDSDK